MQGLVLQAGAKHPGRGVDLPLLVRECRELRRERALVDILVVEGLERVDLLLGYMYGVLDLLLAHLLCVVRTGFFCTCHVNERHVS